MDRLIKTTDDGSRTLYVPALGEHYHSIHGAVQESEHIFIRANFLYCKKQSVKILEFGMGTGLNVLLTYIESLKKSRTVYYHSIEKYPINKKEVKELMIPGSIQHENQDIFKKIHHSPWNKKIKLTANFTLYKEERDFRECNPGSGYDLVYFDAFAPDVQPDLWSESIFNAIGSFTLPGGILTTYSSKGMVKRNLRSAGFEIEKLAGPPGKREFIRGRKT